MGRAPCCDKNGLKKGPWTPEEDLLLINYIQKHGSGNWRTLPKNAGLQRCGKSCRLRWTNYLRPDIKRGRFSFEEEEAIIQLHSILGNKWSAIAARLPGRTDNEIKNYWNTHIRKRLLRMGIDPVTHAPRLDLLDLSTILTSALCNPSSSLLNTTTLMGTQAISLMNPELLKLVTTLLSLKNENPELFSQCLRQNQIGYNHSLPSQLEQQISQIPLQASLTSSQPQTPFDVTNNIFSCYNNSSNPYYIDDRDNLINSKPNSYVDLQGNTNFHTSTLVDKTSQNLNYDSVLSTPLNSSSTNINSSTEDERDSYCSNLFNFEIPESLDINELL